MGCPDDSILVDSPLQADVPVSATSEFPKLDARRRTGDLGTGVLLVILLLSLARAGFLACCGLELAPDEAYYWDWSRTLDWGYYSKPPLVAWSIAASTALFGSTEWAIRIPSVLYAAIGMAGVFALTNSLYGRRAAWLATLITVSIPGVTVTSYVMTIDSPLLGLWAWGLYGLWHVLQGNSTRGFVIALLATGVGLLAKQTMLAVFPLALIFLGGRWLSGKWQMGQADRARSEASVFRTVVAWMVGSLLFLAPVVWWNAHHQWATFEHTQHHFQPESTFAVMRQLAFAAEFLGGMLGILSPILGVTLLAVLTRLTFRWRTLGQREVFLLVFSALPLLGVVALSFIKRVHPNWPAPFFLAGIVLLAGWATGKIAPMIPTTSDRRWLQAGIATGLICVAGLHGAILILPRSPFAHGPWDLVSRLNGWKTLALMVDTERKQQEPIVAISERGPVSELAFYLPGQPRVLSWTGRDQIESQHDVWGLPAAVPSEVLVLMQHPTQLPLQWIAASESANLLQQIPDQRRPGQIRFSLWRVHGLSRWPSGNYPSDSDRRQPTDRLADRPIQKHQ